MPEPSDHEGGDALDRPVNYRTLCWAFAVWAAHFGVSYGAALIFPSHGLARFVGGLAALLALAALFWMGRRLPPPRPGLALAALMLAAASIGFGTFPAVIG